MEATLQASRRERFGRNEAVRLRQEGKIPAVLYGGKDGAQALAVDPKALSRILHSESGVNTLIALKMGSDAKDTRVLVKEYQVDPVSRKLLHADFYRIAMDKVLQVTVPIRLTGEAKGVKAEGGVVDWVHRDIELECLPADIPEHITIDISELGLHDGVRVKDLPTGGKWKPVSELDMLIVHVVTVKVVEEPTPAEGAAAAAPGAAPAAPAEPEVIKKGKVEKPDEEKE
jgi:large subunit ribosomal protein L25